jgi:hypothetical protein
MVRRVEQRAHHLSVEETNGVSEGRQPLGLKTIQARLDELAELRLAGLTHAEQLEYFELIRLEAEALEARDDGR